MIDKNEILRRYRSAVRLLDGQRKILIDANADKDAIETINAIIRHLNGLPEMSIVKIVGGRVHRELARQQRDKAEQEAASMSLSEIERIVTNAHSTRAELEAIAVGRFQVPRGSLRSLSKTETLKDKISTLIENEKTHEAIGIAASGD